MPQSVRVSLFMISLYLVLAYLLLEKNRPVAPGFHTRHSTDFSASGFKNYVSAGVCVHIFIKLRRCKTKMHKFGYLPGRLRNPAASLYA